jgi:hypothetical protein
LYHYITICYYYLSLTPVGHHYLDNRKHGVHTDTPATVPKPKDSRLRLSVAPYHLSPMHYPCSCHCMLTPAPINISLVSPRSSFMPRQRRCYDRAADVRESDGGVEWGHRW